MKITKFGLKYSLKKTDRYVVILIGSIILEDIAIVQIDREQFIQNRWRNILINPSLIQLVYQQPFDVEFFPVVDFHKDLALLNTRTLWVEEEVIDIFIDQNRLKMVQK